MANKNRFGVHSQYRNPQHQQCVCTALKSYGNSLLIVSTADSSAQFAENISQTLLFSPFSPTGSKRVDLPIYVFLVKYEV
jgi:hypothetical protein